MKNIDKKNNNAKAMFIKTKDFETSENLKKCGFELINYTNGIWTFVNDSNHSLTFDNNKIAYSNMLCI